MITHHTTCGHPAHHCGCHGFMTVEEEVKMLEKARKRLESQLATVNERIEKLKE